MCGPVRPQQLCSHDIFVAKLITLSYSRNSGGIFFACIRLIFRRVQRISRCCVLAAPHHVLEEACLRGKAGTLRLLKGKGGRLARDILLYYYIMYATYLYIHTLHIIYMYNTILYMYATYHKCVCVCVHYKRVITSAWCNHTLLRRRAAPRCG